MVLFRADGRLLMTQPENELGKYHDVELGNVSGFDHKAKDFIELTTQMSDAGLRYSVNQLAGLARV